MPTETTQQLAMLVVALGGGLGLAFGVVAHKIHFCTMGAVSDVVNMGHWGRMRMWLTAIAVAIAGSNALDWFGVVDLSRSAYTTPYFPWLAYLVGGGLFGVGMTLASGCGSRNVVRLGGGSIKSLVVLVCLGLAADMTIGGMLEPVRVEMLGAAALRLDQGQDLGWVFASLFGTGKRMPQAWLSAMVVVALFAFVLKDPEFRRDRERLAGGVIIGLLVVAGWYITGRIGFIPEDPETLMEAFVGTRTARPESFTYVGPVANTLEFLRFGDDRPARVSFGVAVVLGTLAGSFVHAIATRRFRWEGFASFGDFRNHLVGGLLMGFGGVTAVGCTVGQGISGLSTLALGSMLVFLAIVGAAAATMRIQYQRMLRER
jgi:hypothetical protein